MKKINYLWMLIFIPFLFSCSEEELQLEEKTLNIEERIPSEKNETLRTTCTINGLNCGRPNSTITLTYNSDFNPNNVNWSILSGSISIIGGQGTNTVTLRLGSNFNGGSVYAIGSGNGGIVCSDSYNIVRCPQCTPPTSVMIRQVSGACQGDIFKFTADPNGSTDSGSYQWSAFQGATIISGQGTATVRIQSPSSGGFSVSVNHTNSCNNTSVSGFTLAEFSSGCGGFGF